MKSSLNNSQKENRNNSINYSREYEIRKNKDDHDEYGDDNYYLTEIYGAAYTGLLNKFPTKSANNEPSLNKESLNKLSKKGISSVIRTKVVKKCNLALHREN